MNQEEDTYSLEPPQKKLISEVECAPEDKMNDTSPNQEYEIIFSQVEDKEMTTEEEPEVEIVKVSTASESEFKTVTSKKKNSIQSLKKANEGEIVTRDEYLVEGQKALERDYNMIHEETSRIWLPKNLPLAGDAFENPVAKTKYTMPITVRINVPKPNRKGFNKQRVMVALLRLFQSLQPESYFTTLIEDPRYEDIIIPEEVPLDEKKFNKYMERAITGSRSSFAAKLVLKSNWMLHEFKYQESFIDYLRDEYLNIDLNNLECVLPAQVGFFEYDKMH
jgi:hypothetical protein